MQTIGDLPKAGEYGLYIHIPFCTRKCDYCHFFVVPHQDRFETQLMNGLRREWASRAPLLGGLRLVSIYFGGGTPSLLDPAHLEEIIGWFQPNHEVEVTLEANPEHLTPSLLSTFRSIGINRLSIGLQTLDDKLLRKLSRQHSADCGEQALWMAREAGFDNVSADLMVELPGQSLDDWKATLSRISRLPLTHLSLYNLTLEPRTVFYKQRQSLRAQMPSPEVGEAMYRMAQESLEEAGLKQYEISAFCREGKWSTHNTGYWKGRPFLGLGPSAFSYWEGQRFRNVAHLNQYAKSLENGLSPVDYREDLTPDARRRELLAVALRLLCGVDLEAFQVLQGTLEEETHLKLKELIALDLLKRTGSTLSLTPKGILLYDSIASELI